jgi:hypothetical protein
VTIYALLGPELPGAACKGRGGLWDDIVDGETVRRRTERHEKAQAICADCPVRAACLRARFEHPPPSRRRHLGRPPFHQPETGMQTLPTLRRPHPPGLQRCQGCDRELKGDTRRRSCSTTCRKRASERRRQQQRKVAA